MEVNSTQAINFAEQGSSAPRTGVVTPEPEKVVTKATETEKSGNDGVATNEQIKKAVEQINKNANGSEAVFGIHDKTNRVTIKIVDKSTKDVIKEFPAEETLDMIAKVWEMAGIMIDEKR